MLMWIYLKRPFDELVSIVNIYILMCTTFFMKKSKLISTRIPADIEKQLEEIANRENIQKTVLFRKAIIIGLQEIREEYSLDLYKKGKVTLWKAAELAQLPLWEMLDKIKEEKIQVKYEIEDAKEDLRLVFGDK